MPSKIMTVEKSSRFNRPRAGMSSLGTIWFLAGLIFLSLTFWTGKTGILLTAIAGVVILMMEFLFRFRENNGPNPYFLMIFSPLLLIHYSTIGDFNIRLICFLLIVYIITVAGSRAALRNKINFPLLKPLTAWTTAFLIFSIASVIVFVQGVHLSGDEPHYLMVTQSIIEDGDFNLENNFKNKTYYEYLPVDILFHGKIHRGRYVSYHMPGVSFLLLPFYALFNLLGSLIPPALFFRLVAAVINSFFALALYTVLKIQFPGKKITGIWILFLCLFPLIFHAIHLYPELPAAALMMGAFIFAFGKTQRYWLSGLSLSLVAWFHVKYYPAMVILALFIVLRIFKDKKTKQIFLFLLFPLVNFILLMVFCRSVYDTFNPADIFPGNNYLMTPVILRVKVLLAYFLDQRDGLLFYGPLFFLGLFAFKKKLKHQNILIWIGLSYIIFHAFTTVRGAYSPAGRPLVFVSWILVILIANFYFESGRDKSSYGFKLLAGLGFFMLFWLFYYPFFVYEPVFSHTVDRASNLFLFLGGNTIKLWTLFPSFLTRPVGDHPANFIWLGGLITLILIFYLKRHPFPSSKKLRHLTGLGIFLLGFYLLCLYPHVHLVSKNQFAGDGIRFFNNSRNFRYIEDREGFNILAGQTYKIFLVPQPDQQPIGLLFSNTDRVKVTVYNKTRRLFRSNDQKSQLFTLNVTELKTLTVKKRAVIPLEIRTRSRGKQVFLFMQII